jgi:protein-disulfide isomerase
LTVNKRDIHHPKVSQPGRSRPEPLTWFVLGGIVLLEIAYLAWSRAQPPLPNLAKADSERSLGPATAPVTIIEYGDFGCPTCKSWEKAGVLGQIRSHYGDQVRFIWRDFPVITADSPKAAEAALCAADQGQFWKYHDLLYARAPALSIKELEVYAVGTGLDSQRFNLCLDGGQHAIEVQAGLTGAREANFVGPPDFEIGGKYLNGPAPLSAFQQIIDPILRAAPNGKY